MGDSRRQENRFHGVRLRHCATRDGTLAAARQVWLCAASHHDSQAFIQQQPELPATKLFGDLAYPTPEITSHLKQQHTRLIAPQKKPKGKDLTLAEKYYNRLVRRIRQPVESLFNWIQEKPDSKSQQSAFNRRADDPLLGKTCSGFLSARFLLLIRIKMLRIKTYTSYAIGILFLQKVSVFQNSTCLLRACFCIQLRKSETGG
jgi:hypothetical protein